MPSASSIRHKPSSWDCASIGNVKRRHRKDTYDLKASTVLTAGVGFCNTKSTLFVALLRTREFLRGNISPISMCVFCRASSTQVCLILTTPSQKSG